MENLTKVEQELESLYSQKKHINREINRVYRIRQELAGEPLKPVGRPRLPEHLKKKRPKRKPKKPKEPVTTKRVLRLKRRFKVSNPDSDTQPQPVLEPPAKSDGDSVPVSAEPYQ